MTRPSVLEQDRALALSPSAWLARWLSAESETILAGLVTQLIQEFPEVVVAREDPHGQVRTSVAVHLEALAGGVDAGGATIPVPPSLERATRGLARHDAPTLPVLLRSFERIHSGLWEQLLASTRTEPHLLPAAARAEVLEHASNLLFGYFRSVTRLTAAAFAAERALLVQRTTSRRADAVAGLLAGRIEREQAQDVLGYDLAATHVAYVGWADSGSDRDRLDGLVRSLCDRAGAGRHLAVPGDEETVHGWIGASSAGRPWSALERALPEGLHLAWGAPHDGVDGFRRSHAEALEARRLGAALGAGDPVLFDDVAVAALGSRDLAAAEAFTHRQLGRLVTGADGADRLLQTLRVYLAELASPTRTARRLHVHPNTVVKRLERIETLIGRPLDPGSVALRVAVELAPLVRTSSA